MFEVKGRVVISDPAISLIKPIFQLISLISTIILVKQKIINNNNWISKYNINHIYLPPPLSSHEPVASLALSHRLTLQSNFPTAADQNPSFIWIDFSDIDMLVLKSK